MSKLHNNKKGFTLIELVVAIGLLAILAGFVLVSLSAIPQAKMTEVAQTLKSEFELSRNFAKTHGGQVKLSISRIDEGLLITRSGDTIETETHLFDDRNIEVFYQLATSDLSEYTLGKGTQHALLTDPTTLEINFAQTSGSIIGPHKVNYLILSNGSKNYKLIFQHTSGMVYFDYELDNQNAFVNDNSSKHTSVEAPYFILNGEQYESVAIPQKYNVNGEKVTVQPEIVYDSRYIKIGGDYRAMKADNGQNLEYVITFTLKDPSTMSWSDNYSEPTRTLRWRIS